jgi:hypothetical protein
LHETPHDYYRYTEFALRKICADNQLEVVELQAYGGYLEVLFDLLSKGLGKSKGLSRIFQPIAKWIVGWKISQKIQRKTSARFPLGYVVVARKI